MLVVLVIFNRTQRLMRSLFPLLCVVQLSVIRFCAPDYSLLLLGRKRFPSVYIVHVFLDDDVAATDNCAASAGVLVLTRDEDSRGHFRSNGVRRPVDETQTDMSSIPEEGAGAADVDADVEMDSSVRTQSASVEDRAGMPTTLFRQSGIKPPTSHKRSMDATWKPYDATQKGNRNATKRSLAVGGQSIAPGGISNSE
jgi:hypothetical protein